MSAEDDSGGDHERRLQRLITELDDEGVELADEAELIESDGVRASDVSELHETLLQELLYARRPPVHERRAPGYGGIVIMGSDLPDDLPDDMRVVDLSDPENPASARPLANGITTFLLRSTQGDAALAVIPAGDEASLVRLSTELSCWIVQRHPNGTIRVFARERLYLYEVERWSRRPYGHTRWMQLAQAVAADAAQLHVGTAIMDFCLHVLSARRIAATVVWRVRTPLETPLLGLTRPASPVATTLDVTLQEHQELLATLLASTDGACMIDPDGSVVAVEAFFEPTPNSKSYVSMSKGTRHATAARHSFDDPDAVVFVVSADGPVTVFSDGADLLRLDLDNTYALSIPPPFDPTWSKETEQLVDQVDCPTCSKRIIVEARRVPGYDDAQAVTCPVCANPIDVLVCYDVRVQPAKPWHPADATITWGWPAALATADMAEWRRQQGS